MKKLCIVITAAAAISLFSRQSRAVEYPLSGRVVEINYISNAVTLEDGRGMLWSFYGTDGWRLGDRAACIMQDNATPDVLYDDKILTVCKTSKM